MATPGSSDGTTYDSCTFVAKTGEYYGCYTFRSCKSCLETPGCFINELGVCAHESSGQDTLASGYSSTPTSYNEYLNHQQAFARDLVLPNATSTNAEALYQEQNWHFRSGQVKYCPTTDSVCQECKRESFWRTYTDALPDSRFCVGQSGCVCIQTCEVPTYQSPGCQWRLDTPSKNSNYDSGYNGYYYSHQIVRAAWWQWIIIVALILVVRWILHLCAASTRGERERKQLVQHVRFTLGRELS